jgi:hypothetical protein
MAEQTSTSIVSVGDLGKPADTLIKKVSKAIGGIFEPYQITRIAKAEAEASLIKAQSEIQITDLHRRAMNRFINEEAQRQENIEAITNKALPQLTDRSDPNAINDDWMTNFFDKSRIVSDEEMQNLWSRVLAGEANKPGTFSKRTVNFLSDIDKSDAESFRALCSFGWQIGAFTPLVFDTNSEIYTSNGLNFGMLTHLDSIGLIQFDNFAGFSRTNLPKSFAVLYGTEPMFLTMESDNEEQNKLPIGKVLLTNVGRELATVCNAPRIPKFVEFVKEKWKKFLPESLSVKK